VGGMMALTRMLTALAAVAACSGPPPLAEHGSGVEPDAVALGVRYDTDAEFRRDVLVDSLVNPDNGYSKLRLERYTDEIWGSLPEWNPRAAPVQIGQSNAPAPSGEAWHALEVDSVPWERDALVALGREAFRSYPVQLATYLGLAIERPDSASTYGVYTDAGRVGDAVWTELPADPAEPAVTCATCHGAVEDGAFVAGKNAADLDIRRLTAEASGGGSVAPEPGLLDVTADGVDNPTAIADLRAVRSQVNLQRAATVRNGLIALTVRTETLIITSLSEVARPPRKLAFALALYLWSLDAVPVRQPDGASARGSTIFGQRCAGCHRPPDFSGPAVALEVVGTDPLVGESPDRTTGRYRVPSLRGIGDRRRLTATGAVEDLHEMLSPSRRAAGHRYGLDLGPDDRADLIRYLETL
jgi:mono/diheme cytochrome c family protein